VLKFLSENYRKLIYDTVFDDITILHVNLTYEKLSIHGKMFCKLDVRRKLIITLALSLRSTYDGRLIYKASYEGRKAFLKVVRSSETVFAN